MAIASFPPTHLKLTTHHPPLHPHPQLDNTYIIYTSDNGYHLGQFGIPIDKRQPYESDLRVPMYVRGPGIKPATKITSSFALNIDVAPTVLELAGVPKHMVQSFNFDGQSLKSLLIEGETSRDTQFLVEYYGEEVDGCWAYLENDFKENHSFDLYDGVNCGLRGPTSFKTSPLWDGTETFSTIQDATNNTYACVRSIDDDADFQYCEWDSGEVEAFDLVEDFWQLKNLAVGMTEEEVEVWHDKLVKLRK